MYGYFEGVEMSSAHGRGVSRQRKVRLPLVGLGLLCLS